ncbi:glutamate--cysteine ligase [Microbispora sp. NPDC049125]|uniref:carboxylate-amine ligase n=1 Tax=Microbispora sp. NPDC049125 TaxID=3154929 RepID=UPI003467C4FB
MPEVTEAVVAGRGQGTSVVATVTGRPATRALTLGVEEEFLLLDPTTGRVVPAAEEVRRRVAGPVEAWLVPEMTRFQLETNSAVHTDLRDLRRDLLEMRIVVAAAAQSAGVRLAACGTPLRGNPGLPPLSRCPRYHAIRREFRGLTRGQGVCGCHVHVGIGDREEAVQVSNHIRPWLPVLQALTCNSPICDALDTGYASWRAMVMSRWPSAEPPPFFRSAPHYDQIVSGLQASGAVLDRGMIYWLVRLSDHVPTLEFRAADVCATVGETAVLAGLVRALAATALSSVRAGVPAPAVDHSVLRAAYWRAARDSLEGEGLDLLSGVRMPAWRLVRMLVDHVRSSLEDTGDWTLVASGLARLRRRGSGAARQRAAFERRGHLPDVVDLLVRQTLASPRELPC